MKIWKYHELLLEIWGQTACLQVLWYVWRFCLNETLNTDSLNLGWNPWSGLEQEHEPLCPGDCHLHQIWSEQVVKVNTKKRRRQCLSYSFHYPPQSNMGGTLHINCITHQNVVEMWAARWTSEQGLGLLKRQYQVQKRQSRFSQSLVFALFNQSPVNQSILF